MSLNQHTKHDAAVQVEHYYGYQTTKIIIIIIQSSQVQWRSLMYFSGYTVLHKYMDKNGHIKVEGLLPQGNFEHQSLNFVHFYTL